MKARIPGAQQGGSANMMKKIQEMQEEIFSEINNPENQIHLKVQKKILKHRNCIPIRRDRVHRQRRRRSC